MRSFALVALAFCLSPLARADTPVPPNITETSGATTQIDLTFDQPMLTWNEKANLSAIRVQPDVSCQWYWPDDTVLRCRTLDRQPSFHLATDYHLSIGHGLWSQSGVEMLPRELVVETDRPVLSAEIYGWVSGVPQMRLASDQTLTPEAITQAIGVDLDGHPLHFQVASAPESKGRHNDQSEHQFELRLLDLPTQQGVLRLHIHPGLKSAEGPLTGKEDKDLLVALVNEPFHLREASCDFDYRSRRTSPGPGTTLALSCLPDHPIGLYFSGAPSADSLASLKSSLPAGLALIDLKDVKEEWGYYYGRQSVDPVRSSDAPIYLKSSIAASKMRLTLGSDFIDTNGRHLAVPATLALTIGDYPRTFDVKPNVLVAPAGSDETPVLQTRNVPLGPQLVQMAIGDRTQQDVSQLDTSGRRNQLHAAELPDVPNAVREHGGLVLAGAKDERYLAYAVAYAPFNVLVSSGDKRLLVWASTWGESRNLDGARVELLVIDHLGHEQILEQGVTGADGVAMLDVATNWGSRQSDLPRLVRVTQGNLRTIVPVLDFPYRVSSLHHDPSHHHNYRFGQGSTHSFGVSDRPLYRPGETVSYRVWFRQRNGNHLLRSDKDKQMLRLGAVDTGKTLQKWPTTLDGVGSATGTFHLPSLLVDGTYCINVIDDTQEHYYDYEAEGACFQVARFEAQPLWAQLKADRKTVLAGQDIGLQLDSGYFSGDAAANVAVSFDSLLTPKRLEDAYPDFAAYTFIDPFANPDSKRGSDPLQHVTKPTTTDREGKAHFSYHVPLVLLADSDKDVPIPFGLIEINASVNIPGKASASSGTVAVNYSQYPRFVGLKSAQWWLPIDRDPDLGAVVISHGGHAIAGQTVQVSIEDADDEETEKPKVLGHCELIAGQASPCAFRAPKPGRYRFRATAKDAAPAIFTRYIGAAAPLESDKAGAVASLALLRASDGTSPARVRLHQPYPKANVLFTIEYGDVVSHWVQAVNSTDSDIDVPVVSDWAPGVTLHALIRMSDAAAQPGASGSHTVDAVLDLDVPKLRNDTISVSIDHPRTAPGQDVVLRLTNTTAGAHHATIALVDDSIYQQASEVNAYADPSGENWLDELKGWEQATWYGLEGWSVFSNPFFVEPRPRKVLDRIEVIGSRIRRAVDLELTSPAMTLTRADIAQANGSGLSTTQSKNLERIEVVGSRIRDQSELFARSEAVEVLKHSTAARPGKPLARVRNLFVDSAYWNPDVPLAAGETKELRIHLPDNLTRWRVLVWASNDTDGFALTQTTLETALPVELRAGLPGQLYVGDQASASLSARNHGDKPAAVSLTVQADGAGVKLQQVRRSQVAGNAEMSQRIAFAPDAIGDVNVLARATKPGSGDGLSSSVPVLSRMGDEQTSQTGWIGADSLDLPLPLLPTGASSPVLDVQIHRGLDGWREGWLRDLRDYPHRCWEQTLSRAVGAALAIDSGQDKTIWPKAQAEVRDALIVAPNYQDESGNFRFFIARYGDWSGSGNPALSAYTLRSFELLQGLGFELPQETSKSLTDAVRSTLEDFGKHLPTNDYDNRWEIAAQSAGALIDPKSLDDRALNSLWDGWSHLSWYGRSELVRAFNRKPKFAEQAKTGIQRLREAGEQRGLRRLIKDTRDFSYFMGSDLRDQCAVVGTLYELDKSSEGETARLSLLRGLQDLYSGGTASLDTQASAQCLMALHTVAKSLPVDDQERQVLLSLGSISHSIALSPKENQAHWSLALAKRSDVSTDTLHLQSQGSTDATLNYSAEIRYQIDLQQAKPQAVGMRLERSYQVLRNGAWIELAKTPAHEGDWVRVRLVLDVPAFRHFVAITDIVPGGLVSRDISLSSVGGADLKHVGNLGSWWFDSRRTGQNDVKIYAEQLPPGTHEVFYYAQAVQSGDYFAPPAIAELMYGRASRSTTASARLVILPAQAVAKH